MEIFSRPALPATSHALLPTLIGLTLALAFSAAQAQSFCASDNQHKPVQLMERFINANCAGCWADTATPQAAAGTVAIDWVAPGDKGDDAPLSAVATRDSLARLAALNEKLPTLTSTRTSAVGGLRGSQLRVAHGLPVNDYIGASIELRPVPAAAKKQTWTAWLTLVETLPAGTEGSPVERNLVRNLLQTEWDGRKPLAKGDLNRFFDARSMALPQGANAERLRVIGWVQDPKGKVLAAAESRCVADKP